MTAPSRHLQILHLSDFHFGMTGQKVLWPTIRSAFYDDLRKMHRKCGPWDLVVFSGDFTQKGEKSEYETLTLALTQLWKLFGELGFEPKLFVVPGNHDLQRPDALENPAASVLEQWEIKDDLRKRFWQDSSNPYKTLISAAFKNFTDWTQSLSASGLPQLETTHGILPGDSSSVLVSNNMSIGLVGLNSTWLQLGDGDYRSKLHIDLNQFSAVATDDPDAWCAKNDFNFIVTHHPLAWLSETSRSTWRAEIDTRTRFDAHIFGHMHELSVESRSVAGALHKRSIQAASLFGLEKFGTQAQERRHGYSLIRTEIADERRIRIWPRRAQQLADDAWKLVPDYDFHLEDDEESISYTLSNIPLPERAQTQKDSNLTEIGDAPSSLSTIRKELPLNAAFTEVRKIEQAVASEELNASRPIWIVSDWGLGTAEFVASLKTKQPAETKVFQLEIDDCFNRNDIYAKAQEQLGFAFQQLGQYLHGEGNVILILEDASIAPATDNSSDELESDLREIVNTLTSFASRLRVIITSKLAPTNPGMSVIKLQALDEPDTASYIAAHPRGGKELATTHFVTTLHRHTDGIPARIDTALQNVQLGGLSALSETNSDISGKRAGQHAPPPGLVETLEELESSSDPSVARALQLLKALAMFPSGERFNTVRRFNGADGFYLRNAQLLTDCALVDTKDLNAIGEISAQDTVPALVVKREVREYLYATLPAVELKSLTKKAMALYFGKNWQTDEIRPPPFLRFNLPGQGAWVLNNASMMVMRSIRDASDSKMARQSEVLNLATSFATSLSKGNHYRAAHIFCSDAVPLFEEANLKLDGKLDLVQLKMQWARSARMIKQPAKAKEILIPLLPQLIQKEARQSGLLLLAMSHQALSEVVEAVKISNACIKLDPKTSFALQAQSILLEISKEPDNDTKLRALETLARRRRAFTVADNIALSRAERSSNAEEAERTAQFVSESAGKSGDHYNALRATIILGRSILKKNEKIGSSTLIKLITGYHYLYSQRFDRLFDDCHDVLWSVFEATGEISNLLRLFRHSSFVWRLRGEHRKEDRYLKSLRVKCGRLISAGFVNVNVETAYFLARLLQREDLQGEN